MSFIAIMGAVATVAALWLLIRGVLQVRRHREGLRHAGVSPERYVLNEIVYLTIYVAMFGVALAVTVWAMH